MVVVNDFLEPLMHIISDLMREKISLHLIQFRGHCRYQHMRIELLFHVVSLICCLEVCLVQ